MDSKKKNKDPHLAYSTLTKRVYIIFNKRKIDVTTQFEYINGKTNPLVFPSWDEIHNVKKSD